MFGLERTHQVFPDAYFPDGRDGNTVSICPTTSLPRFTGNPVIVTSGCDSYTLDGAATRAVAECAGQVMTGTPDSSSLAPTMFEIPQSYDQPRLAPGGTLYVRHPAATPTFYAFHYQSGSWMSSQTVMFVGNVPDEIGVPSDGGGLDRRMILLLGGNFWEYEVVSEDPGAMSWNIVNGGFSPAGVGLSSFADPMLSPDGLRVVFKGTVGGASDIYVLQRPDKDTLFSGTAQPLYTTAAAKSTPFLRSDCGRLYFSQTGDVESVGP